MNEQHTCYGRIFCGFPRDVAQRECPACQSNDEQEGELRTGQCEWESPAVPDFDGSGWVSFDCNERATHVVSFVDSTIAGSGYEEQRIELCEQHAPEVFTAADSDAAMHAVTIEAYAL